MFALEGPKPDFKPKCSGEALRHLDLARNLPGSEKQMLHLALGLAKAFLNPSSVDETTIENALESLSMDICRASRSGLFGARLAHLHRVVFDELRISRTSDYYTEAVHFLPEVISKSQGTSTMLAFFYVELAKRCGLRAGALLLPSHVLAEIKDVLGNPMRIDVDDKGRILTNQEIYKRLKTQRPEYVAGLSPEKLSFPTADMDAWLERILTLPVHSAWAENPEKSALAYEIRIYFKPQDMKLRKELGLKLVDMGEKERARPHLEAYLRSGTAGNDYDFISRLI